MLDPIRTLLANQYEAAFATLAACVDRCPDDAWDARVVELAFCQVVFHTLFFADYYLGPDADAFRVQPFHRARPGFFRDYEELEPRRQVHRYERPAILEYLEHCRTKAAAVVGAETAESLAGPSGFVGRDFTRAELHVYNIRHVQHHAAALGLGLARDHGVALPWFGSG